MNKNANSETTTSQTSTNTSSGTADVRVCRRCIMDTSISNVRLDREGICNHCRLHDKLDKLYPLNEKGKDQLRRMVEKIKRHGRNQEYDCIVGVSGGRDTTYCLYMTKKLGLRPLAVHFDNGWDSQVAKTNLANVLDKLNVDLHTVVADWEESRDLTNCTIRSSLPYIDMTDDVGIVSALYRTAAKEGIRWIIHSHSFRTEGINPLKWNYMDGRLVRHLIRRFGTIKLKYFQNVELRHFFYWVFVKRICTFTMTNLYDDVGVEIDELLKREFDWQDTGGWHFDNEIFGLQCYYSRHKFGIDWRICEYAAWVRTGAMSREEAQQKMKEIPDIEGKEFVDYGLKKQGISTEEWNEIMAAEPKYFTAYPTYYSLLKLLSPLIWLLGRMHVLPAHTYEKYFRT
ncbi:MAG: N-acetyl sugar amidotransferase [Pirellulaceae bacterium]